MGGAAGSAYQVASSVVGLLDCMHGAILSLRHKMFGFTSIRDHNVLVGDSSLRSRFNVLGAVV